ncbi:MAG: PKD domain-containing protein, partial [Bacteroidia bacterium]
MKKILSVLWFTLFATAAVKAQEPTVASSNGKVGTLTCTSAQLSWTSGNGTWRMGLLIEGSGSANTPSDGTKYTAVAAFGSGTNMGTNSYVVYDNITNSVNITNLKKNTSYEFRLYEHNGGATPDYLTSTYLTITFKTQNLVLDFDFTYTDSCQNTNFVQFTNKTTATYSGIKYTWLFQDGMTDTGKNVNHVYTKGGSFLVTLLAAPALGCTDNFTSTKAVFIIPRPVSIPIEQNNDTAQCFVGHQFKFDDQTQLAKVPKTAYIRTWYFGPGD